MNRNKFLVIAALASLAGGEAFAPRLSQAATLKLSAVADTEVGERPGEDRGAAGAATSINIRTITTPVTGNRNEIIALRFDLTGVNLANVSAATLNMVWHRDSNTNSRPWVLYGVNDGAVGGDNNGMTPGYDDNTWAEATVRMSTMPGLIYDGDSTTQGVNATTTTNLGTGTFVPAAAVKGTVYTFNAASLLPFLSSHPDNLVSLLVAAPSNSTQTGQDRFATKEATSLDAGTPTGAAGFFAPYLELTVVPEPATAVLATCISLAMVSVARRRRV
jgi:hypothetical protein